MADAIQEQDAIKATFRMIEERDFWTQAYYIALRGACSPGSNTTFAAKRAAEIADEAVEQCCKRWVK